MEELYFSEVFHSGLIAIHCVFPGSVGGEPLLVDGAERRVFLALFFAEQRRQAFQRFFFRAEAFFSGDYALFLISLDTIAFCYLGRPRVSVAVYASGPVAAFGVFACIFCLLFFAAPAAVRGSIGDSFAAFDTIHMYIKKGRNASEDKRQMAEYRAVLGNKVPNNLDAFQRMKYNEPEKWELIKLDKNRRVKLKTHPELALPDGQKSVATEKFTGYLFNPNNKQGWAKGQAFTSRLGYTADSYESLRREIISGAKRYPAVNKGDNGYGIRYEQKMILYGETGNPANVVVGWIFKDGNISMTTAYISEVR